MAMTPTYALAHVFFPNLIKLKGPVTVMSKSVATRGASINFPASVVFSNRAPVPICEGATKPAAALSVMAMTLSTVSNIRYMGVSAP